MYSVTVRQVPFTEIESPSWASERMVEQEEIVSDVPPPPEDVESRELSSVTAVKILLEALSNKYCLRLACGEIRVRDAIGKNLNRVRVARIFR